MSISALAVVSTSNIGARVTIHPFAVIGPDVTIGTGVTIHPHVVLEGPIDIGEEVEILPGVHIGRMPSRSRAVSREPGKASLVRIGARTCIGSHSVIYTGVQIGSDTMIGDGVSIREGNRIGDRCVLGRYVTINYDSEIGDGARVMDLSHITGNTKVGADVFISCLVGTVNDNALGRVGYDAHEAIGPTIEKGAAVGGGAILLPGVVIGPGATVGAGAVVTKDVPGGTTVMGVPAKPRQ